MKYSVYKHTSPDGRVYIGITSQIPEVRWGNGKHYQTNSYFTRAIEKFGWDNFLHEILSTGLTKDEAEQMEIELIAFYASTDRSKGFNISFGGKAPSSGLHWKRPPDGILRGENHPMYGVRLSDQQKEHLRKLNSANNHPQYGTHRSEETKRKISESQKGKKIPLEQRKRISESLKGHIPSNCKKVLCVETGIVYESVSDAKRALHISNLYVATHDETKTAGGFHWKLI